MWLLRSLFKCLKVLHSFDNHTVYRVWKYLVMHADHNDVGWMSRGRANPGWDPLGALRVRHAVDSVERWQHLQQPSVLDAIWRRRSRANENGMVFLFLVFGVCFL